MKRMKKGLRALSMLLCLVVLSANPAFAASDLTEVSGRTSIAIESLSYLANMAYQDVKVEKGGVVWEKKVIDKCSIIGENDTVWEKSPLMLDWITASTDITLPDRVTVKGTIHLILKDGVTLSIPKGIYVPEGSTLVIYGQEKGTGKLEIEGGEKGQWNAAGIGGNGQRKVGTIVINGGDLHVIGDHAAGIGGGFGENSGMITINGGTVRAAGYNGGAGIGGGTNGSGDTITINGGWVEAMGSGGAGIGGGSDGSGGKIIINEGDVFATGISTVGDKISLGAGIGSGLGLIHYNVGGDVTINGGNVTATGGDEEAMGIGHGYRNKVNANLKLGKGVTMQVSDDNKNWEKYTKNVKRYMRTWTPAGDSYTVTFKMCGHGQAIESQEVESGETAERPEDPTAKGYNFTGWYTEKACKNEYNFNWVVTGDLKLFAGWEKKESAKDNLIPVKKISHSRKGIFLKWAAVSGADGYDLFTAVSDREFLAWPTQTVTGEKAFIRKVAGHGRLATDCVRYQIRAYKMEGGEKVYIAESLPGYSVGPKNKVFANAVSIQTKKGKLTLSEGESAKLSASVTTGDGRDQTNLVAALRYSSSDESVAKVNKKGKVTAVGTGSCKIYVTAANGLTKSVKVKVR